MSALFIGAVQSYCITLTAPVINESQEIAFLVCSTSKATAVKQVLKEEKIFSNTRPS
ncbi:MAG: 6-phosphogluconolactonase [Chitinophagaceae bacterium]|nr:6-phosphogluconolactonase [Chitinophagaceae bacterium]